MDEQIARIDREIEQMEREYRKHQDYVIAYENSLAAVRAIRAMLLDPSQRLPHEPPEQE